jgi:cytochrome c553
MKKNKYLLLASSAGVLLLLVIAAFEENFVKEWRRIQGSAFSDEGRIPVQLRQVVNRQLGVADRCVSCHVAMGPGEQGVRGHKVLVAHPPVVHDPSEYGCTVCHGGQGQATEKADAHGDVHFWPEPMLPKSFSRAGCGTCHVALQVPERTRLQAAQLAFERLDCLACHRVDGRGGTLRPGGGGMEGPDLSRAGVTGYNLNWHDHHLREAAETPSGPWRSSFAPVNEGDRQLLKTYLDTRVAAPDLVEAKSLFLSSGCLGCHRISGVGGDDGPDLTLAGQKDPGQVNFQHVPGDRALANWMAEHFRAPASVVVGSQMPPAAVPDSDVARLTLFTLSLRRRDLRDVYLPKDRVLSSKLGEREFASDGATLFGAFCAGCHGTDGLGRRAPGLAAFPSVANPDFLSLVTDEFLTASISQGRPGRRMPGWAREGGLRDEEIRSVVAHLRQMSGVEMKPDSRPPRWAAGDTASGKHLFDSVCAGCHGPGGKGAEAPALNNKVLLASATDTYLFETIGRGRQGTTMEGFLTPTPTRPALDAQDIESIVTYLRSLHGGKS